MEMDLAELVTAFRGCAIASVADAVDRICGRRGYLHHSIKPRINDRKIVAPAVTVLEVPTDEVLPPQHALDIIDAAEPGSVIVISVPGQDDVAVWGGLLAAGAVARRHDGAVLAAAGRVGTEPPRGVA